MFVPIWTNINQPSLSSSLFSRYHHHRRLVYFAVHGSVRCLAPRVCIRRAVGRRELLCLVHRHGLAKCIWLSLDVDPGFVGSRS